MDVLYSENDDVDCALTLSNLFWFYKLEYSVSLFIIWMTHQNHPHFPNTRFCGVSYSVWLNFLKIK